MDPGVKFAAGLSAVATCVCLIAVLWSDPGGVELPEDGLKPRQPRSFSPVRDEPAARPPTASIRAGRSSQQGRPPGIWPPPAPITDRMDEPPRLARDYPPRLARDYSPLQAEGPGRTRSTTMRLPEAVGVRRTAGRDERRHRIADGDTLPRLAERYLGSAERYLEIYEHNRDVLRTPGELPIGLELRIPPAPAGR